MRFLRALFLLFPLAGCFDADVSLTFLDDETARMSAVMSMGPELFAMVSQTGEDLCPDGTGAMQPDGGYVCSVEGEESIDTLIAEAAEPTPGSPVDVSQGYGIERLEPGLLRVSFDLREMMNSAGEGATEGLSDMEEMLRVAFEGHAVTLSVSGAEIIETNGTLSEDRKTASFVLPLLALLDDAAEIPASFDVIVRTN